MSFTKPAAQMSTYEPVQSGSYPARLYSLIHIGTLPFEWQGETKMLDKVRLTFELPTEKKVFNEEKGEQPYVLSCEFTFSTHKKGNLRQFLSAWNGKEMTDSEAMDLDLEEYVGKTGLANVVHSEGKQGQVYANIQSMTPLPKGLDCPPQINPTFILDYQDQWSEEKFNSLPEFLREKIKKSDQYCVKQENKPKYDQVPKTEEEIDLTDVPF